MKVKLNGVEVSCTENESVEKFLENNNLAISQGGFAVAINETVVSKFNWEKITVKENDKIIVITATQGG